LAGLSSALRFHDEKDLRPSLTTKPTHRIIPIHDHEFVRPPRRHEKSFPFGGFGLVRAIDFWF
jgi:hypothetical protein